MDKRIRSPNSSGSSKKSSSSSRKAKKAHTKPILLNYGIEIETVFELIDEYNTYMYFASFYEEKTVKAIKTLIIYFKILKYNIIHYSELDDDEFIINLKRILEENSIFIELDKIITFDETDEFSEIENYLEDELAKLLVFININQEKAINLSKIDIVGFAELMNIWKEFLSNGIMIISYLIKKSELKFGLNNDTNINNYGNKILNVLLNGTETPLEVYENFSNRFNLTHSKVKIYNNNDDNINDFYRNTQNREDEILLNLTSDLTVNCNNKKIYKTVSNAELIDYKYLLNCCEFITQVFKTTDEIESKLSIFFSNDIIKKSLYNCSKTSQHVHISFNIEDKIILPDIYIIISIVCVCYYFQDEIFKLFLITRTNNLYCSKLNFNSSLEKDFFNIINDDANYNENLNKIMKIFYTDDQTTNKLNRYFWLNLMNLYKIANNNRPYTIEFRLKHGSIDATELKNVCILYENIINYAIKLSDKIKKKTNIIDCKIKIDEIIRQDAINIFNQKILLNIYDYFKNASSEYVKGLNKLNTLLIETNQINGGVLRSNTTRNKNTRSLKVRNSSAIKSEVTIQNYIRSLDTEPIYKRNSFGFNYIGNGLDTQLKKEIYNKLSELSTKKKVNDYLKLNNIYIKID